MPHAPLRVQTHVALVLALVAAFAILPATPAAAATVTQAGITYETAGDGTATVTGFDGSSTSVTIPDSITEAATEYLVVAIADHAFDGNALTSVIIGDEVRRVGRNAFWNSGITSLTLGSSVETIAWAAFEGTNLGDVVIPSSVTTIENYAFASSGLTSVTIDGADASLGYESFARNPALATVDLGDGATTVGERAFQNLGALTSLDLGNTRSVGYAAFEGTHLGDLTIPTSVTTIGSYAFRSAGLTSLTIHSTALTIERNRFDNNPGLTTVAIGDGDITIGKRAFQNVTTLTSLDLGNTRSVGYAAFEGTNLGDLTIPTSVTTLGNYAFKNAGLTSLVIDDAALAISREAFYLNPNLTSADLGDAVTSIGDHALANAGFTHITIPGTVTSISSHAFSRNGYLSSVTLNPGLETIGYAAFYRTTIEEVVIPHTVTYIGDYSFMFTGIRSVVLDDAPAVIGAGAFWDNHIETLDLGTSVTEIRNSAFAHNALTTLTVPAQVTLVGPDAFSANPLETVRLLGPHATYLEGELALFPGIQSTGPFGPGMDPLIQFSEEHRASGYTSPTVTLGGATYRSVGLITVSIKTNLTAEPTVLEVPSGWVLAAPSLVEDGYWLTSLSTIPAGIQVGEALTESATITAELAPTAVSGAASAVRGEPYRIEVAGVPGGGRVAVELHSAPVDLGTHEVVDGAVTVTIPSDAELGAHDLVVTGEQYGTAVGTVQLTVAEPLAETGPDGTSRTMGLALLSVLMGVAALLGRRLRY